jgi:YD repeat-containing protein
MGSLLDRMNGMLGMGGEEGGCQTHAAFSVSQAYDGFDRMTSTTDVTGTTSYAYDLLNRVVQETPPGAQKAIT